jgi:hypothetical protein
MLLLSASIATLGLCSMSRHADAQERTCPDGGRAYFGYCPSDRPAPNIIEQQLEEWAYYPDEVSVKSAPDILEGLFLNTIPQKLYDIVLPYDRSTIKNTDKIGTDLQNFKDKYYNYRRVQLQIDKEIFEKAGSIVASRDGGTWSATTRYVLLRLTGHSQDELKKEPQFLFGVSFDEGEKTYLAVNADPHLMGELRDLLAQHSQLEVLAASIAQRVRESASTLQK